MITKEDEEEAVGEKEESKDISTKELSTWTIPLHWAVPRTVQEMVSSL